MIRISVEKKRKYIAQIATKIFAQKGYRIASLNDVAIAAGLSKAGVYHYFKSKEDLFMYVVLTHSDNFLTILNKQIKQSRQEGLDPQESFKQLIRVYARHVNTDPHHRGVVLRERHMLLGNCREELLKREREMYRILKNELVKIPNLNKKMSPSVITFLFIGMSHWLGRWVKDGSDGLSLDEIIEQNIAAILDGVLVRQA